MKMRSISTLMLAAALALLLPFSAQARQQPNWQDIEIQVLHDYGQPYRQYPIRHHKKTNVYRAYLEATPGDRYAIRVRNRTAERIGVVIAVDGRNIISGAKSDLKPDERMYILGPYQEAVYDGWRTGKNKVHDFYFTGAEDSYAGAWGDYSAMGVIAVAAYRELKYRESRKQDVYPGERSRREGVSPHSKPAPDARSKPGTGFGDEQWSPSRRVHFEPERKPFAKYFVKYEWREVLCRKGIIECRRPGWAGGNRFWDELNRYGSYAPFPPGYWDR